MTGWHDDGAGMFSGRCPNCAAPARIWQFIPSGPIAGHACTNGCDLAPILNGLTIELVGREALHRDAWIEWMLRLEREWTDAEYDLFVTVAA